MIAGLFLAAALALGQDAAAHVGKGAKLMTEELYSQAAGEFERALATDPSLAEARFQYAVCLLAEGRNEEARAQFERVRKQAGESPYITYYLGRLDLLSNDYQTAIKKLSAVALKPPAPDTPFYLGTAYISAGNLLKGIEWLERAAKAQPKNYRVHYRLARAYSAAGREQAAKREYELYSQLSAGHKSTEAQARACTEALRTQALPQAREVCRRMFDPNDPEKLTLLGQLLGDGKAFAEAVEPLQRAVRLDPGSHEAWHNLGVSYFRLERYKEARMPLEKAVALRPDFYGSVVLLGATLYMLNDDAAALPVLERANKLNPADAQTAAILKQLRATSPARKSP